MRNLMMLLYALLLAATALIFPPALPAATQEQVLRSFQEDANGAYPISSIVRDPQGNLYGTTNLAGDGSGVVFELTPASGGQWTFSLLHTFNGATDGGDPYGGLIMDQAGNFFGATSLGGSAIFGTAFELSPGSSGWTYTVLHNFGGGTDGAEPFGDLIADSKGNMYGATSAGGGSANCSLGCGTVFEMKRSGGQWSVKILYSFQGGADGSGPAGALALDSSGNLFGVTTQGGSNQCTAGCGTAFELSPTAHGPWQKKTLTTFADKAHGWFPNGGVKFDQAGNLWGTTELGGNLQCNAPNGCGAVYKLAPQGTETVIHGFSKSNGEGTFPMAGLTSDGAGHFFGTTSMGGQSSSSCGTGCGTVFEVTAAGKTKTVYSFAGADGAIPQAPLFWDGAGNLFGTTLEGGSTFTGTVFELTP